LLFIALIWLAGFVYADQSFKMSRPEKRFLFAQSTKLLPESMLSFSVVELVVLLLLKPFVKYVPYNPTNDTRLILKIITHFVLGRIRWSHHNRQPRTLLAY
jgi:lysylphosphatidylglycerol synthetase-like protein (DUF2156 family)